MNIVYASDDNFAEILGISIISLFENNIDCEDINVYILDDKISDENKHKLNSIGEKYNRKLIYISVDDIHVPNEVQSLRWSKSAFIRIFMRQLIPKEVNKVLYLDCDTLICDELTSLFEIDIEEYCAAGVRDCISHLYLKNIDLLNDDLYCNSGVLLINLNKWCENEFLNFFKSYINAIKYPDQDIINGVCGKNTFCLNIKYNCYTVLFDFTYKDMLKYRKPSKYYSEQEVLYAKKNPVIVHFTTSFLSLRPWVEECKHPYVSEWLRYKKMSPWIDMPLRKDNRSVKKKFAIMIYKFLPNRLSVSIAGLLHSNIVPMIKKKHK